MAALRAMLMRPDAGLVTVTGPGGSGKTRLSLQVAAEMTDQFPDGAFFVPLASITEPNLVVPTIVRSLGIPDAVNRPSIDCLTDFLASRHALIVLDNFEQVLPSAPLVGDVLAACSGVKILVTSRSPLQLQDEREFPVRPLALPDLRQAQTPASVAESPAVALFVERVRAIQPDFAITDENAAAIVEICCRLDGLPLAIELAAARIRLLDPHAMLARLERRLPLLTSGSPDRPARQQNLRATISWSFDLLSAGERQLIRRLAVFIGGCTLEAGERVCSIDGPPGFDTAAAIEALITQSLLHRADYPGGVVRIAMLETIREYAFEQLELAGEVADLRRRHAEHLLELLILAEPHLHSAEQLAWLDVVEREHDNVRAALTWSREAGGGLALGLRLASIVGFWFWRQRGYLSEGRRWLETLLAADVERPTADRAGPSIRSKALAALAFIVQGQGEDAAALPLIEEALTLAGEDGDSAAGAWALVVKGRAFAWTNPECQLATLEESLERFQRSDDALGQAYTLLQLGTLARDHGDRDTAARLFDECITAGRRAGDRWILAAGLQRAGLMALMQGQPGAARSLLQDSLTLARDMRAQWLITQNLRSLAAVAVAFGSAEAASVLLGAEEQLRGRLGTRLMRAEQSVYDDTVAKTRAQLGDVALVRAWERGRALPLDKAVAHGLSVTGEPTRSQSRPSTSGRSSALTQREEQVTSLVAEGLSNPRIAARLVISERTVHRHLSNILNKLGLDSRTQVAVWAVEHGLHQRIDSGPECRRASR